MKILFIEACNYVDFPIGGQLSFAEQIVRVFGDELYLIGISTDDTPVGRWVKKEFNGVTYNYFSLHKAKKITGKPLVPRRLSTFYYLKKYKKKILSYHFDYAMCCAPEVLVAVKDWGLSNLTYNFSGIENPLNASRYWYGKLIRKIYDPVFYPALQKARYVLAAADHENIRKVTNESNGVLKDGDVIQFPTRINMNIFKYRDRVGVRKELNLPLDSNILVSTSRLHWIKGWKMLLDAFKEFLKEKPDSYYYFLGDGGSRVDVEAYVKELGLDDKVRLIGFQSPIMIAKYLNAADLYLIGSFPNGEGYSTSLLEAKGSCVPLCASKFSSSTEIVDQGVDGYVAESRDPKEFAATMLKAIDLRIDPEEQERKMKRYSAAELKNDLFKIWHLESVPTKIFKGREVIEMYHKS